jgi:hypothetical protein
MWLKSYKEHRMDRHKDTMKNPATMMSTVTNSVLENRADFTSIRDGQMWAMDQADICSVTKTAVDQNLVNIELWRSYWYDLPHTLWLLGHPNSPITALPAQGAELMDKVKKGTLKTPTEWLDAYNHILTVEAYKYFIMANRFTYLVKNPNAAQAQYLGMKGFGLGYGAVPALEEKIAELAERESDLVKKVLPRNRVLAISNFQDKATRQHVDYKACRSEQAYVDFQSKHIVDEIDMLNVGLLKMKSEMEGLEESAGKYLLEQTAIEAATVNLTAYENMWKLQSTVTNKQIQYIAMYKAIVADSNKAVWPKCQPEHLHWWLKHWKHSLGFMYTYASYYSNVLEVMQLKESIVVNYLDVKRQEISKMKDKLQEETMSDPTLKDKDRWLRQSKLLEVALQRKSVEAIYTSVNVVVKDLMMNDIEFFLWGLMRADEWTDFVMHQLEKQAASLDGKCNPNYAWSANYMEAAYTNNSPNPSPMLPLNPW